MKQIVSHFPTAINRSAISNITYVLGHNLYGFDGAANPFCDSGLMDFARRMVDHAGSTNIGGKVLRWIKYLRLELWSTNPSRTHSFCWGYRPGV